MYVHSGLTHHVRSRDFYVRPEITDIYLCWSLVLGTPRLAVCGLVRACTRLPLPSPSYLAPRNPRRQYRGFAINQGYKALEEHLETHHVGMGMTSFPSRGTCTSLFILLATLAKTVIGHEHHGDSNIPEGHTVSLEPLVCARRWSPSGKRCQRGR